MDTANPPASSNEVLIRDPLESFCRLRCKLVLVLLRLYAAAEEALFVLMLIIVVFLYLFVFTQLPRCPRAALDEVFDLTLNWIIY
jgi:hypothetical protein